VSNNDAMMFVYPILVPAHTKHTQMYCETVQYYLQFVINTCLELWGWLWPRTKSPHPTGQSRPIISIG